MAYFRIDISAECNIINFDSQIQFSFIITILLATVAYNLPADMAYKTSWFDL